MELKMRFVLVKEFQNFRCYNGERKRKKDSLCVIILIITLFYV